MVEAEPNGQPPEDEFSAVFISHATEDQALAEAWRELLLKVSVGAEDAWYSSDPRAKKGINPGDWRRQIGQALSHADTVIILLTPASNERMWPTWETGVAHGSKKEVIPVYLFMEDEHIHDLFKDHYQCYDALEEEVVLSLCEQILYKKQAVPPETRDTWRIHYQRYEEIVLEQQKQSFTRALFVDTFHNRDTARALEGIWTAHWYHETEGGEELFASDALQLWTTDDRVRLVGRSDKPGVEQQVEIDPTSANYPMEGVVSSDGWIALSYWSAAKIPICGTALLKRRGAAWTKLVGTWEGYTAKTFEDDPDYTHGRVEMFRAAANWNDFDEMQEAQAAAGEDG